MGRTFATDEKPKEQSDLAKVKVPVLFGVGLYVGVVLFSKKQEAEILTEMRAKFRNEKE